MTPTNTVTDTLRTLHRIQRQLTDLKSQLARGPRLIQAHLANVEKLEANLAEAGQAVLAQRTLVDDKQMLLSTRETNVAKRRGQLNAASSNVEYQALKDQIAADVAANDVLEVEILEGMEKLDGLQSKAAELEKTLAIRRAESDKCRQGIEENDPKAKADIERLQAELQQAEEDLPEKTRALYRRMAAVKGEDALAVVDGRDWCGGCNQQIPLNTINALMLAQSPTCKSCGRLLYLPEGYSR